MSKLSSAIQLFLPGRPIGRVTLAACLLISGSLMAQIQPASPWQLDPSLLAPAGVPVKSLLTQAAEIKGPAPATVAGDFVWNGNFGITYGRRPGLLPTRPQRITLEQAQQQAASGENPLVRLGQLQVEAAKRNRLATRGDYFPKVSLTFINNHFNKILGESFNIVGREIPVTLLKQDQTIFSASAIQPITPLFAVRELVKIAEADENIAKAKAAAAGGPAATRVEKTYFALLIAKQELAIAEASAEKVNSGYLLASNSPAVPMPPEKAPEILVAQKAVVLARTKERELTASLNSMLGWHEATPLELVAPEPLAEGITLEEISQKALEANPEVIEAEQTAIKAQAGHKLAKMQYFPVVAAMGGYARQTAVAHSLLRKDFAYIGFIASFDVFDGGKRENVLKQRAAQEEAAQLGVQLTKAKAAESLKKAYFEMTRARELSLLSHRMMSASGLVNVSSGNDTPETREAKAMLKAEMLKAELAHREAYTRLRELMGER